MNVSIVVTARNDQYGGDLLGRAQNFADILGAYFTNGELIVVDWNPPEDRRPMSQAVKWPETFPVRHFVIPPEYHRTLPNSDTITCFEYLGKNAGIRRAHGDFILCTDIDICFSPPMISWLNGSQFDPKSYYRADRSDVFIQIPKGLSIEERLAHCKHYVGVSWIWDGRPGHTEASGDFMMMSKDAWHQVRGYPEVYTYYHIDSYGVWQAMGFGLNQVILPYPIYHQPHGREQHALWPKSPEKDLAKINDDTWGLCRLAS